MGRRVGRGRRPLAAARVRAAGQGKLRFLIYTQTMTSALFITFLERLIFGSRRKIFLIVDRLRAHRSAAVDEWVRHHAERLAIF